MKSDQKEELSVCENILRLHGGRVTTGRVALLALLRAAKTPLSVLELKKAMTHKLDIVSLYRGLDFLVATKLVSKINLQNSVTYFEYVDGHHHHHHIVCESCGLIEDIEGCHQENMQTKAAQQSQNFKAVTKHSLEFFGICHTCAK